MHGPQHTLSTADTPTANGRLARGQLHRLVRWFVTAHLMMWTPVIISSHHVGTRSGSALARFAATALVAWLTVFRSYVTERKLIGTWRITAAVEYHEDGSEELFPVVPDMEITLTADHKEVWRALNGEREAIARWHVEGNDLVSTMETNSDVGPPGTTRRERIAKITSDEVIFSDGKAGGRWTRVR